ncbi:MAG: YraN family protein [Rhodospirillaceae bacterium]|nr:YraN family protein [Rhodospirillales bacterium]
MTLSPKLAAWQRGKRAETLAAWWLRLKGYRVLARGYAIGRGRGAGEVDLIVRRGDVVAFVEIKARATLAQAAHAITPNQQDRIIRAARAFVSGQPKLAACVLRFDAVLITPKSWPRHISDAWRMDT